MTDRQNYIQPATRARPDLIVVALRRIAQVMDLADDQKQTVFFASLGPDVDLASAIGAWSQAAMLLADTGDITSAAIRMIANHIQVGGQDALF